VFDAHRVDAGGERAAGLVRVQQVVVMYESETSSRRFPRAISTVS
jgi:hypothetical protein